MNLFEARFAHTWRAEQDKKDPAPFDRVLEAALAELYGENSEEIADEAIFRSNLFGRLGLGTALQIQRRITLRLMDR